MARYVATDNQILINDVDFSSSIAAVTLALTADEVETTSFSGSFRSRIGGLKDATVTLDFHQDFGANAVDATLFPLLGTAVTIRVTPTSEAISETNPGFEGDFLCTEYSPFENSVGDLATLSISWPLADNAGVTRLVAPPS